MIIMYKQIKAVAIDTRYSPVFANIIGSLENL